MLSMCQKMIKIAAFVLAALVLSPPIASSNPIESTFEPVWEKIDGEWKFNNTNKQKHHNLVYVITSTKNNSIKNILTKDMVKLPFVQIIEEEREEEISLH